MDKVKLFDALDGLYAYDSGATDSGIRDGALRREVKTHLGSLSENDLRFIMSEFIRVAFVSEEALSKGYGIGDVAEFLQWLKDEMCICL